MSEYVYAGMTSQTIDIFLRDSSSTTGQGLSGLVYNSAGLVASYRKGATGSRTAITLATQTVGGAYSSGGFVEIDATNMKGVYRLDIPNAAVDTEGFVTLYLYGATNLLPTALRIDCRPLPVDVKKFGGTAGTFAAGIPTVVLDSADKGTLVDLVWDEATSGHTTAGTYGGRIVRATNSNTEVQITGSNHIAADVHEFQTGVITAGDFAANAITASALATDAVTEIQSGLATAAALATESGKITNIENASGYLLAVLAGACADPQTASETYAITVFGSTFTVDMAGQTSTGTRTAPTLTKA